MKNLSITVASILFLVCCGTSAAEKIDINNSPLDDLIEIIHIGEKRALELIALRPFSSLDDLARIKGIGPARIEDIKKQGLAYVKPSDERAVESSETVESTAETGLRNETSSPETKAGTFSGPKTDETLKVDINTASAQELQVLVGIGAMLAQRIIDARPFCSLDELTKVNGIGAGTLESIKNQDLAWVDSNLAPSKTEKVEIFNKKSAAASVFLQQIGDKKFLPPFSLPLIVLVLAAFSGTIILVLKKKLKAFS